MKIVLQKQVENLGDPGEIVQVADGYARNYLIPRGLAVAATKGAVKHVERLRAAQEQRVRRARADAEALAGRLAKTPIRLQAQAGEDGRLFGSVTGHHIADQLEAQVGEKVDHRDIRLEQPIRSLGTHTVTVHLHPEVDAAITIDVAAQ